MEINYLGVEGEAGFGLSSDSGLKVKSAFAGFGVARMPVGEKSDLFARVGYHTTKVGFGNASANLDGVAWGVGGNYMFTDKDGVRLDYTRYQISGGGLTASSDSFAVAYVRKF